MKQTIPFRVAFARVCVVLAVGGFCAAPNTSGKTIGGLRELAAMMVRDILEDSGGDSRLASGIGPWRPCSGEFAAIPTDQCAFSRCFVAFPVAAAAPFWFTSWFLGVLGLVGLVAFFQIARYRTRRRALQRELLTSEERYRTLVANIPGAVYRCACDADWTMEIISDPIADVSGYRAEGFIGNRDRSFTSIIHPEDRGMVEAAVLEAVKARRPYVIEYRVMHADGGVRWVYEKGQGIFDELGQVKWLDGAIFDITQRKEAELRLQRHQEELEASVRDRTDELVRANRKLEAEIHERERAEEAKRESEGRYRDLFNSSRDGIAITDMDGKFLDANPAYMEMIGYGLRELEELSYQAITPEKWASEEARIIREQVLTRGYSDEYEKEYVRKDGKRVPITIRVWLMEDSEKRPAGLWGVVRDISERKDAEAELLRTKQQLQHLISSSPSVLYSCGPGPDYPTTFISSNVKDQLGYEPEAFYADPFFWAKRIHPDDAPRVLRQLTRVEDGARVKYEYRIRHRDGRWVWNYDELSPLEDGTGRIVGLVGSWFDITARKEAEKALEDQRAFLRQVIDVNPSLIFSKDRVGRFTLVNRAVAQVYGTTPEELLGKTDADFNPNSEEVEFFRRMDLEVMDTLQTKLIPEEVVTDVGGETHYLQTVKCPIVGDDGRADQVLGVATDITARKRAEDALKKAHDELERRVSDRTADLVSANEQLHREISERKRAEAELRAGEERLQAILDNTTAVIYVKNVDGKYILVNHRFEELFHFSREELVGKSDHDLFPKENADAFRANDLRVIESGRALEMEELAPQDDGDHTYISIKFPLRDSGGAIYAVCGISTDITERKRSEEAAANLAKFPDEDPSPVLRVSTDGTILYANQASRGLLSEWGCSVGQGLSPEWFELVNEALRAGKGRSVEVTCSGRVYDLTFAPVRPRGYVNLYGSDITLRKHAEARTRRQALVFENMYDAVLLTDLQGRIVGLNPSAERMFGYSRGELVGQSPEILNRPSRAAATTRMIQLAIEHSGRWSGEIAFVRRDGTEGVCEASVVPLRDEKGRQIGTISVNRDITASKMVEKARKELKERLRHAQQLEAVGTLASGIAHEFENLLTAISACTDLARTTLEPSHPAALELEKVDHIATLARGVTNALLTLSHRGSGEKSPVNLCRTIQDTIRLLRRMLPEGINIIGDLPTNEDLWLLAGAGQVQRILINLATNARDAMPEGGRLVFTLRVSSSEAPTASNATAPGTRSAFLTVEDTGCGMSEELRRRVFEPFLTTKERGEGTGLGMTVTQGIVEDLGGTIDVWSQAGEGTRVSILLPCCDAPADALVRDVGSSSVRGGGGIVVIGGDEQVRSIISSSLRQQGYEVVSGASPTETAAEFVNQDRGLRLVIFDLESADDENMSTLAELRRSQRGVPMILLSGTLSVNLRRYGMEDGFVLRKPFEMTELASTVKRCLRQSPREGRST